MPELVTHKTTIEPSPEIQVFHFSKGAVFTGVVCQYVYGEDGEPEREVVQLYHLNPDPCYEVERRRILCVGTGWKIQLAEGVSLVPIDIARSQTGKYIWHVYEVVSCLQE